jgi:uncharacterized protein YndB with AHSA1/START domain
MTTPALFNFIVSKEAKSITVERSFNAPLDTVWAAWTEADILCKWWAPKPYECVIAKLDFLEGGRWSYYMQGPEGDRHYCFFDYGTVRPKSFYSGRDGFSDEHGVVNTAMPSSKWDNSFRDENGTTLVQIRIHYSSAGEMERIIAMGFKEGFTAGLDQLDELLTSKR